MFPYAIEVLKEKWVKIDSKSHCCGADNIKFERLMEQRFELEDAIDLLRNFRDEPLDFWQLFNPILSASMSRN